MISSIQRVQPGEIIITIYEIVNPTNFPGKLGLNT